MPEYQFDDGRVLAVDKRDGSKRRVMPHILKHSKNLSLAPSERAKGKSTAKPAAKRVTEPKKPKRTSKRATSPASKSPEPDTTTVKPVTEPVTPETKESE